MKAEELLKILAVAEKLKCNTRHCCTSTGRPESVAEHCWRTALMAMLCAEDFPEADMDKVIRMCLIHDLGEAFTGDIPTFEKTDAHEQTEAAQLDRWVQSMPVHQREEFSALYREMNAQKSLEAKLYKAFDRLEAVIQHNESDIATWLPLEYDLQLRYGAENVAFSPALQAIKDENNRITREKIAASRNKAGQNHE